MITTRTADLLTGTANTLTAVADALYEAGLSAEAAAVTEAAILLNGVGASIKVSAVLYQRAAEEP